MKIYPFLFALFIFSCGSFSCGTETRPDTGHSPDSLAAIPIPDPIIPSPCDGFDFPVGPPDANGYYNAQKFTRNEHLGDDWNGLGGGNTDLGDPVYSVADGIVVYAEDWEGGWGNVIRVWHNMGTIEEPDLVESLYGHLDTIMTNSGDTILRGQQIGTIGDAHGMYYAHLHLEIRDSLNMPIGGGYDGDTIGWRNPTKFIRAHRPD